MSLFGLYLYQMYKRDPAQMVLYCTSTALCTQYCSYICPVSNNVHNIQHAGVHSMLSSGNRSSKVDITADSSGKEHELTGLMEEDLAL